MDAHGLNYAHLHIESIRYKIFFARLWKDLVFQHKKKQGNSKFYLWWSDQQFWIDITTNGLQHKKNPSFNYEWVRLLVEAWLRVLYFNLCYIFVKLRVHCAEALGTPIVGDYKYGWFVHRRWKQMPRVDIEPTTGKPYKLRRPEGLDIQKGSVLSKVPLLHLHCRELILPNIAKFLRVLDGKSENQDSKPDLHRFIGSMPSHMKISWNIMSSYLV